MRRLLALAWLAFLAAPSAQAGVERNLLDLAWSPDGRQAALLLSKQAEGGTTSLELCWIQDDRAVLVPLDLSRADLLGWTWDGEGVILDDGRGTLHLVPAGQRDGRLVRLPEEAVVVASDGRQTWYLGPDGSLVRLDAQGRRQAVAPLPAGLRPPGTRSGEAVALRRPVRQQGGQWATEVWVLEGSQARLAGTVPGPFVRVAWGHDGSALALSCPGDDGQWQASVVERGSQGWKVADSAVRLPSPLQLDRSGGRWYADAQGLWRMGPGPQKVRDWAVSGERLLQWSLSPTGDRALVASESPQGEMTLRLYPLPRGAPVRLLPPP
jgi:hypothetical protein